MSILTTLDTTVKPKMEQVIETAQAIKEISYAKQAINKSNQLQKCTGESLQTAVYNICLIGLSLNPVKKECYLVPRYSNREMQAFLEPSYQGLVKLITDTGSVKNITAQLVYENDNFEVNLGTTNEIKHTPESFKDRGNVKGVYAVATLPDGNKQIEIMSLKEIDEIKEMSESYKAYEAKKIRSCVWVDHFGEMARKTVIRRICKYLPKTEQWDKLHKAINLDEQDYKASDGQKDYALNLLDNTPYDERRKSFIRAEVENMSRSEISDLIMDLQDNQLDSINSGSNYQQRDISKKLNEI